MGREKFSEKICRVERSGVFELGFIEEIEVKFCRDRRPRRSTPQGFGDHKPSVNGPSDAGPYKKGAAWWLFRFYQHPDKPKFEILKQTDKPKFERR